MSKPTSTAGALIPEPKLQCKTCGKKGCKDEMTLANNELYCNSTCYDNSTQICCSCLKEGKASTFESFFEDSPRPGGALAYCCMGDDREECHRNQRD